jgi:hypothetical protein
LRKPFVVLDSDLRVKTAIRSFYDTSKVTKDEMENRLVYELGNEQCDISGLRGCFEIQICFVARPIEVC